MEEQVKEALGQAFPGIRVDLEEMSGGRLSGSVVWAGFGEYDQVSRQALVRDALRETLGVQVQQVGVLLTYTPNEIATMQAA